MDTMNSKKILVALDGSEYALEAVRFASETLNPKTTEAVLFHALRQIDDAFWNVGMKEAFLD